jgi:hypothetical protein
MKHCLSLRFLMPSKEQFLPMVWEPILLQPAKNSDNLVTMVENSLARIPKPQP